MARRVIRGAALPVVLLAVASAAAPALAQGGAGSEIQLDGSIGDGAGVDFFDEASRTWHIDDSLGEYSPGGTNLFHSFSVFSVPLSHVAEFSASEGLPERVFARVTEGESSRIAGTLRSDIPGADLYLLNPAGVVFEGGGAAVDVGGSFFVTTADVVRFSEGPDFPADVDTGLEGFSHADPVAFGFLAGGPGAGSGVDFSTVANLAVPEGETFAAVGGDVGVLGSTVNRPRVVFNAPGARLALVAAGPGAEVPVDPDFDPAALPGAPALGEVAIDGAGVVLVNGSGDTPAGSVVIRGGQFRLAPRGRLSAINQNAPAAPENAIDVAVTGRVDIQPTSQMQAGTSGSGDGGGIRIRAGELRIDGALVATSSSGSGAGGHVDIEVAGAAELVEGARVLSLATRSGPGGPLRLRAGSVRFESGGLLQSEAQGSAPGGQVDVEAPGGEIFISDASPGSGGTGIRSLTGASEATGTGGLVRVSAADVVLEDGGQVLSETQGAAATGSILVAADVVRATGRSAGAGGVRPSGIRTSSDGGSGAGGSLPSDTGPDAVLGVDIDARVVEVADGAEVGSFTRGLGRSGDVVLRASESVLVDGGETGLAGVLARASARPDDPTGSVGPGGAIVVETGLLDLRSGGQLTASTSGTGDAGDVTAVARQVRVTGFSDAGNAAGVFAQTLADALSTAGQGGSIALQVSQDVLLEQGGRLAVETRNGGDAGVVSVETGGAFAMRSGASVSALSTTLSTGNSGSIQVVAAGGATLTDSEISARALGSGEAGTIRIDGGPHLELVRSAITTEAAGGGGGQITLVASEVVDAVDSVVSSSVAVGAGDGGDIRIDPELVLLARSDILARAFDGDGGNIFITADAFLADERSLVDATSQNGGIDGEIVIQSPEVDVASQVVQLPVDYRSADALMKSACATRRGQVGSFVVAGYAGLPASPDGPLPVPLYEVAFAGPAASFADLPVQADTLAPVRIAGLHCPHENLEVIR